jgi:hypothetical protein
MTEDDLKRIAERYTELMSPGVWADMTDAQRAVSLLHVGRALKAALLEGFMVRRLPVRVLVDQDVN